jgi:hypothetical protein
MPQGVYSRNLLPTIVGGYREKVNIMKVENELI